jgi:hypothetical protein
LVAKGASRAAFDPDLPASKLRGDAISFDHRARSQEMT